MADISQWATTAGGNDTGSTPDFPIEGMAPSAVNDTMRTNMAAIKRWYDDLKGYGLTTSGTGNAYTLTTTTTHAALTDQSLLVFEADRANTGSATLNVDGLGAKTIKKNGDENLIANDIQANQVVIVAYENTADVYHLLSPPAAALDGLGSTTGADIANVSGVITTQGDLMIGDSSGDETRLAIGTSGQTLSSDGTTVSWGALPTDSVTATQIASGAVDTSELAADAVTASEIAASAVTTSEVKNTTGSVSSGNESDNLKTMPGGAWGFYPRLSVNNNVQCDANIYNSNANNSSDSYIFLQPGSGVTLTANQNYIQSSPPYDMGDGECGLFVEVELDARGNVLGTYVAPDPVWAYNGPTNIRADVVAKDGRKYKRIRRPALTLEDVKEGRADAHDLVSALKEAKDELFEIDFAFKNSDMNIRPHSVVNPKGTVVLLDPVNTFDLLLLHEQAEDLSGLIHDGYIKADNVALNRSGPQGVQIVSWKWKNTR